MIDDINAITTQLTQAEADLYAASTEYRRLGENAARLRALYDVQYASEFLKAKTASEKPTDKSAESLAVQIVEKHLTDCRIAEALADGARRHLGALEAILSSIQTRARLLKVESNYTGSKNYPHG